MRHLHNFTIGTFFTLAFLLFAAVTSAQDTITTVQAGNWDSDATWDNGTAPSRSISTSTVVRILHDVTSNSGNFTVNGILEIGDASKLTLEAGNITVMTSAQLRLDNASLDLNGGMIFNRGKLSGGGIHLNSAYVELNGNFTTVGGGVLVVDNSCIRNITGNFAAYWGTSISGTDGSIEVLSGNSYSYGTWESGVEYCVSGSDLGTYPAAENCDFVQEECACLEVLCDDLPAILPGFLPGGNIVSPSLDGLAKDLVNENLKDDLFQFSPDSSEVLIDVNFKSAPGAYEQTLLILAGYGKTTADFIYNGFTSVDAPSNFLTLFFPTDDLIELDTTSMHQMYINFVREAIPTTTNNFNLVTGSALNNQGDAAQRSFETRQGFDLSGEGVRIGILSDSYNTRTPSDDAADDVNLGYLPGNAVYPQPVEVVRDLPLAFGRGNDEGRAMAHIIHSVAPEARLYFHTAFEGPGPMAEAVLKLALDDSCTIITDDVTHPTQPFFADGLVASAISKAKNTAGFDISYFTSAGNFGSRAYSAVFNDLNGCHDFGGGDTLQKVDVEFGEYLIVLQWEDLFFSLSAGGEGADNDFNFYLTADNGDILYSFNAANKGADPVEIAAFFVTANTSTNVKIECRSCIGTPRFKYVVYKSGDSGNGFSPVDGLDGWNAGTITGHAMSEDAFTLGAVRFDQTPAFGNPLATESFSSRGDVGQGKPDATAVQGANVGFDFGVEDYPDGDVLFNFFGTSASAPHAAAIAALLAQADQKFSIGYDVENAMISNAIDYGEDANVAGAGYLSAYEILTAYANPKPDITSADLSGFGPDSTAGGPAVIKGQFFANNIQAFFQGGQLLTSNVTDTSFEVTIPGLEGSNTDLIVINPALATGDGGSDTFKLFDAPKIPVQIIALDTSRKYGTPFPEFSFTTSPLLSNAELTLLAPFVDMSVSSTVNELTNVGVFPPINIGFNQPVDSLPAELTELYEFSFVPGILEILPIELRIESQDFTAEYGAPILDSVKVYEYVFGVSGDVIDPTTLSAMTSAVDADYLALQTSTDPAFPNYLGIISNYASSEFLSLSNFRSGTSLGGLSLSNAGVAAVTSTGTALGLSLSNAKSGNASLGPLSLSNSGIPTNVIPIDAQLFWDTEADTAVNLSGDPRPAWDGLANANSDFSLGPLSLSNVSAILNAALGGGTSLGPLSLSNMGFNGSLGGLSLSNGVGLSLGGLSLSNNIEGSSFEGFLSLSNDNSEVVAFFADSDTSASEISLFPINLITGLNVGVQNTIPGVFLSDSLSRNFIVSYGVGEATITEAPLSLTIDSVTVTYGDTLPEVTFTLEGLKYEDADSNVIAGFEFVGYDGSTGLYDIEPVFVADLNYIVDYIPGVLEVQKRDLLVIPDDKTREYGQPNPLFTITYVGFINGDTTAQLDVVPGAFVDVGAEAPVDTYPILSADGADDDYNLIYLEGTLTVEKAVLTVTAQDTTRFYGDDDPDFTAIYIGFVNEDSVEDIVAPELSTDAECNTPIGTAVITVSGGAADNYIFNYVEGTLTIIPDTITVIADDLFVSICDEDFALTYTVVGYKCGETFDDLFDSTSIELALDEELSFSDNPIYVTVIDTPDNYVVVGIDGTLDFFEDECIEVGLNASNTDVYLAEDASLTRMEEAEESGQTEFVVKAFPNPSSGMVNVEIKGLSTDACFIHVIDMTGRTVLRTQSVVDQIQVESLDLTHVPAGVYFITIQTDEVQRTMKLVKR